MQSGTTSGDDRLGTRVQGLPWAAGGVAQALLPVSNVWNASALVTPMHRGATTPPIRAPAFYGHGKAAPCAGPDHEPGEEAYGHPPSRFSLAHVYTLMYTCIRCTFVD